MNVSLLFFGVFLVQTRKIVIKKARRMKRIFTPEKSSECDCPVESIFAYAIDTRFFVLLLIILFSVVACRCTIAALLEHLNEAHAVNKCVLPISSFHRHYFYLQTEWILIVSSHHLLAGYNCIYSSCVFYFSFIFFLPLGLWMTVISPNNYLQNNQHEQKKNTEHFFEQSAEDNHLNATITKFWNAQIFRQPFPKGYWIDQSWLMCKKTDGDFWL